MLAMHKASQQESLPANVVPGLSESETHLLRRLLPQTRAVRAEIGLVRPNAGLLPQMLADAALLRRARLR